jgi:atypical dual specificity phosphatase
VLALQDAGLAFNERTVLQSVSFQVPPTGCTVVLGPAGTGKSALLRTLAGYNDNHPALRRWGEVLYQGQALSTVNRPSMVMQKAQLMVANVLDNLQVGLPDRAQWTRAQQIERITAHANAWGEGWVASLYQVPVVTLSLRQQRIVAVLRETLSQPALLMLDEPTAGLSEDDAASVIRLMGRVAEQGAVLTVLHHQAQARQLAHQVVLLACGRVQESGDASRFFSAPDSEAGRQFLRTGSCPETPTPPPPVAVSRAAGGPASALSAARGPTGFVWLFPGELAGTPWPGIVSDVAHDLRALQNVGVTRLVNLTHEAFDAALAASHGIQVAQWPIADGHAPSATQAALLCTQLEQWIGAGEVIALHCRAGLGRTGTLLAAFWLWRGNGSRSAVESVEVVRRLNQNMIQTTAQVEFLHTFAQRLSSQPSKPSPTAPQ